MEQTVTPVQTPKARHAMPSQERRIAPQQRPKDVHRASDDDILGLTPPGLPPTKSGSTTAKLAESEAIPEVVKSSPRKSETRDAREAGATEDACADGEPANFRAIFDANPDLRRAWHDANAYRETFATPDEARTATAALADLDRMDRLFFSGRSEDHAQLARRIAELDPVAFQSLASAMAGLSADRQRQPAQEKPSTDTSPQIASLSPAQAEFFHATNAATVQSIIGAIEAQVARLLPDGASRNARDRVVGEIYREMDNSLRSNRQLAHQIREAFRAGSLDAEHQRAVVSLITGRARQVLPGVAKRVLNEWTSTVVAASHDRRARQRSAERRVDIAGSGGTGTDRPRALSPHDIDYSRMSDSDILNL